MLQVDGLSGLDLREERPVFLGDLGGDVETAVPGLVEEHEVVVGAAPGMASGENKEGGGR